MRRIVTMMAGLAVFFRAAACVFAAGAGGWVQVNSPHFVVVSNAGEKEARETAIRFEQIRDVFRQALPLTQAHAGPTITILAAKDEDSLARLLPEYWTKGHAHPAGLFENSMNQFYIAINLGATGANPYETIYHEYYHSLTMPYDPDMPTWLSEGLADFFGNSEVEGKTAIVGEAAPELLYQLRTNPMIPLDTLFAVDRSSPYYGEDSKVTTFYAESWALVHYLMIGDNQAHKPTLEKYLQTLDSGAKEQDAANAAFGSLKKLQGNLEDYVRRDAFYQQRYPAPEKISESDLQAKTISEADVDAYEGGFFVARGRTHEAEDALDVALRLDPKNGRAYQNLAITQYSLGEKSEALESAGQAIANDPGSMLARYFRALLTYNNDPGAKNPQIEDDLRAAAGAGGEFAPPYSLLAVYMASQNENLDEALGFARKAIAMEPGNSEFQESEAQVLIQMGKMDEARSALLRARADAADSEEKLHAEMELSSLEEAEKFASTRDGIGGPAMVASGIDDDPNAVEAAGVVEDATCSGGLKLQLSTESGVLMLHNAPGKGVRMEATSAIAPDLTPCGLKGTTITVKYVPDAGDARSGTIEILELFDVKQ